MREVGERLYTPNELAERGILSLVKQWELRKAKRLGFLALGRKILYRQRDLDAYFAACEQGAQKGGVRDAA